MKEDKQGYQVIACERSLVSVFVHVSAVCFKNVPNVQKSIFGLYHRYRTTQEGPNRDLNAGPRAVESIQSANHTTRPSGLDN